MSEKIRSKWRKDYPEHFYKMSDGARYIYGSMWKRHLEDLNFFLTSVGKVGVGKSTSILKLLYEVSTDPFTGDRNFNVETDVVFTVKDYLTVVEKIKPDYDAGKGILFDEIELEADSKGWDYLTKLFVRTCSTMRYKLAIVGATLPIEKQLAFQGRQLRDANIHCKKINRSEKTITAHFNYMDYKLITDTDKSVINLPAKRYAPRRIVDLGDDYFAVNKINKVKIKNIPIKIDRQYKRKKFEYLDEYYRSWVKELDDLVAGKEKIKPTKVFEFIDDNKDFICDEKGNPNPTLLEMKFDNISTSQAKDICRAYKVQNQKPRNL